MLNGLGNDAHAEHLRAAGTGRYAITEYAEE